MYFLLSLVAALPLCAGNLGDLLSHKTDSLMSQMMSGEKKPLFPDPQEKDMSKMREPFDRVIYLFRAWAETTQRAAAGSQIDKSLCEALNGRHIEECWLFTKSLARAQADGKDKLLKKWKIALENLSISEDIAAFKPVFERLPEGMDEFSSFAELSEEMFATLQRDSALASYAARAEFDRDFYAKKRPWHHIADFVENGIDGLMGKLQNRFCKENIIRFFARVQNWKVPSKVKAYAAQGERKIKEALVKDITEDLEDRIEGGLGKKTRGIALVGEFVMTSTSLHNGRIRFFIKKLTTFEDSNDIKLFLPTLKTITRHANTVKLHSGALESDTKDYLKEVCQNLDQMHTILSLKARKTPVPDADKELFESMRSVVLELDIEGLFRGL